MMYESHKTAAARRGWSAPIVPISRGTHEIAWAAGFFDGEGCTTRNVKPRRTMDLVRQPTLSISQIHRSTLERFQTAVGDRGKIYGPYHRRVGKPQYVWRATRWIEAKEVLALLWPYLTSQKRDQATEHIAAYLADISKGRMCRAGLHPKPRRYGKCWECAKAACYRWREKNREHVNAYSRQYRKDNPDHVAAWVAARRTKRQAKRKEIRNGC